jgi:hypothetical protein
VNKNHPKHVWEYAIVWLDTDNNKHRHDPKIAIRSSKDMPGLAHNWSWKRWLGFGFGLLGIALLLSDTKKKAKK